MFHLKSHYVTSNEIKLVELNPSIIPALHLKNPKLWWPKGHRTTSYDVNLSLCRW